MQTPFMPSGMYGMRTMGMYPMSMDAMPIQNLEKGKGKGKEIDFETAFAQATEATYRIRYMTCILGSTRKPTQETLERAPSLNHASLERIVAYPICAGMDVCMVRSLWRVSEVRTSPRYRPGG